MSSCKVAMVGAPPEFVDTSSRAECPGGVEWKDVSRGHSRGAVSQCSIRRFAHALDGASLMGTSQTSFAPLRCSQRQRLCPAVKNVEVLAVGEDTASLLAGHFADDAEIDQVFRATFPTVGSESLSSLDAAWDATPRPRKVRPWVGTADELGGSSKVLCGSCEQHLIPNTAQSLAIEAGRA